MDGSSLCWLVQHRVVSGNRPLSPPFGGVRARWLQSSGGMGLSHDAARATGCDSFGRRLRRAPVGGFRDEVLWQKEVAGHRLRKKPQEGNRHREVTGSSRGESSERRNPKGAIGMK